MTEEPTIETFVDGAGLVASQKEVLVTPEENMLEGSILVHGFLGNIETLNPYGEEVKTFNKIMLKGEIVSPSQRELTKEEENRYKYDAPFDLNRVSFHIWKGEPTDERNYIGDVFFAAPTIALSGYVPIEDPAFSANTITVYGNGGVRIPLELGKLFIELERFEHSREAIGRVATANGMNFNEFVNNHFVILPRDVFRDTKLLWKAVSSRIEPSTGVSANIVSSRELGTLSEGKFDFTSGLDAISPAAMESLGSGSVKEGSAVSTELIEGIESSWKERRKWIRKIQNTLDENPYELESLRDTSELDSILTLADSLEINKQLLAKSKLLRDRCIKLQEQVIQENERILEVRFPDAPIESSDEDSKVAKKRPLFKPEVIRSTDGKLHINKPPFL